MTKVITYGTYDLFHHGHRRLLERAKALGDYLIVGVTSDDFDKARGKINVQQSLLERIAAVQAAGLADEIIVEEFEGQKIDDIRRYGIDIFTVGSDWEGQFDYLKAYCSVIYLPRTEGVSSSELRTEKRAQRLGLVGDGSILHKYRRESSFVNGLEVAGVCTADAQTAEKARHEGVFVTSRYEDLLERVDAVYIISHPTLHHVQGKAALLRGKHVLIESPVALRSMEYQELREAADKNGLILMEANKTAYATAYCRMLLLAKSGRIGKVLSIDATCTSLEEQIPGDKAELARVWDSMCAWGPTAMLPVFQIFGTEYADVSFFSCFAKNEGKFDLFTKIDIFYPFGCATLKVGKGAKSEGQLVISGTKGYIYVPAPWWKTDYFEVRYENSADNKRCFYQLDGEGIRYELVNFVRAIETGSSSEYIDNQVSEEIVRMIEAFYCGKNVRCMEL